MAKFVQVLTTDQRLRQTKSIKKKLMSAFGSMDPERMKLCAPLIETAAHYAVSLKEIDMLYVRDGVVEEYMNGANQFGLKKSVAAELKPKYTTAYQNIIKQLIDLLPTESEQDAAAELMDFINGGDAD